MTEDDFKAVMERWTNEARYRRLDMFATAALTGLLADDSARGTANEHAKCAWALAKAMLDNEPKGG